MLNELKDKWYWVKMPLTDPRKENLTIQNPNPVVLNVLKDEWYCITIQSFRLMKSDEDVVVKRELESKKDNPVKKWVKKIGDFFFDKVAFTRHNVVPCIGVFWFT